MKYPKYVHVSPDAPDQFWDPKAQMWFKKADGIIELKDGLDASNIIRYLRFNYLFDATTLKEPPVTEAEIVKPIIEKTPRQLLQEVELQERTPVVTEASEEPEDTRPECPYCHEHFVPKGMKNHMKFCKKNPANIKEEPEETVEETEPEETHEEE
jgi:hypothetical protein